MSLAELLAEAMSNDREDDREPAMAVEALLDYAGSYSNFLKASPFKPGDLVTPRKGTNMKGSGKPHVVLEVRERPEPHFIEDADGTTYGRRCDIRIASFYGSTIARHWVESIDFDPFKRNA